MKKTRVPRPNPIDQYEALIRAAQDILGEKDIQKVRSLLYRHLTRRPPDTQIQAILDRVQLSAGWVRNHLLSIGSWNEIVRQAVQDGLSLRDGAVVAQIQRQFKARHLRDQRRRTSDNAFLSNETATEWEQYALEPFYALKRDTPKTKKSEGEISAAIRQRTSDILAVLKDDTINQTVDGWWIPNQRARSFAIPENDVWLYDALPKQEARKEKLHPMIARAIVEKYSPPEGHIIDPLAGDGAIARIAVELARWVWPSDLYPQHPLIHHRDAMNLHKQEKPGKDSADLVIVHPPSFYVWGHEQIGHSSDLDNSVVQLLQDNYFSFLTSLFEATRLLARAGGNVAAVLRPARIPPYEVESLLPFLAAAKTFSSDVTLAYHIAAARDGSEDWHILVICKAV